MFEINNDNADCEVRNKPTAEKFALKDTGEHPYSNHDGKLDV